MTTAIKDISFVAFDLETTGIQAAVHQIVEIGAVRFTWQGLQARFQTLVNPLRPIPVEVIRIHGITDAMVQGQPTCAMALPGFLEFIQGSVLLAHNAAFDINFIACALQQHGHPEPDNLVLDTCRLARALFPESYNHKLVTLSKLLNLPQRVQHRALEDSLACAGIFRACVSRLPEREQTPLANLLARHPQGQATFHKKQAIAEPVVQDIMQAISQGSDLMLRYHNGRQQHTERRVTPIYLGGHGPHRYLEAYCHLRQAQRHFRLDRITAFQAVGG